ncbi:S-adenosyl-L-methionine-dependent methyltransferase [Mrakia frigida]|uniref:class I SAM-dependent methyltransferase n=1 Tax=Mrakia frigida TaxID=29902 RepID=UPI003FCC1057
MSASSPTRLSAEKEGEQPSKSSSTFSTDLSVLPDSNDAYLRQEYWEERYKKESNETHFDWCLRPDILLPLMRELIPSKDSRILMLGCGNSLLSEVMYDEGWTQIVNVDYSSALIEQMKEKHSVLRPSMTWHQMDIRELSFEDGSFDVALDKATMDTMMQEKGDPWSPSEKVQADCNAEVSEVLRVLRPLPTSKFLYYTWGQPHFRKRYLTREGWDLRTREIGPPGSFGYYQYVLSPKQEDQLMP